MQDSQRPHLEDESAPHEQCRVSSRRRHTIFDCGWSSDVCSSDLYPMLKKMVDEGLITDEPKGKGKVDHRTYHITKKGLEHVRVGKGFFANFGQRWSSMRRIFIEMLEPEDVGKFLVDGSKTQFQIAQEALESKLENIDSSEARFILKEYALNLERQLDWANSTLN